MRDQEIEVIARAVTERAIKGRAAEDDALIELKADWPDKHEDIARRIAAHANAAQGDYVLWLIGVDEKGKRVTGASGQDPAKWYDQVKAFFENGWAPGVRVVNVHYAKAKTIAALLFDTAGKPFVVKAGARLEVPWRGSTQTRSARRSELLSMLVPVMRVPHMELRRGQLRYFQAEEDEIAAHQFDLSLDVYFTPQDEHPVVLPYHKMKAALFSLDGTEVFEFTNFFAQTDVDLAPIDDGRPRRPPHLEATLSEFVIYGAGKARLKASGSGQIVYIDSIEKACEVRFLVRIAGGDSSATIRQNFARMRHRRSATDFVWEAVWPASLIPRPSGL